MRRLSLPPLRMIFGVVLVAAILSYGSIKTKDLFLAPSITVVSPRSGSTLTEPVTIVEGTVTRTKSLSVNGREAALEESGRFREFVVLHPGKNDLAIIAIDRFGKKTTAQLEVVLGEVN